MAEHPEVKRKLEGLAAALAGKDGFHAGLANNNNAVELEYGQMLYGAVLDKKPEFVVEFGTGPGYSATWLLLGLEHNEKGHLWTIDPAVPQPPVWETVGCPTGRLTYMDALTAEAEGLPGRIDILFHDASHSFEVVKRDLEMFMPRVPPGGVVLVHDVNYSRKMGDALSEWFDSMPDSWSYQEFSMGCGMGVAKRLANPNAPVIGEPALPAPAKAAKISKPKSRRKKSGR